MALMFIWPRLIALGPMTEVAASDLFTIPMHRGLIQGGISALELNGRTIPIEVGTVLPPLAGIITC